MDGLWRSERLDIAFLSRNLRENEDAVGDEDEDEDDEVMVEADDERTLGAERLDAMERSVALRAPSCGRRACDLVVVVDGSISATSKYGSSCQ